MVYPFYKLMMQKFASNGPTVLTYAPWAAETAIYKRVACCSTSVCELALLGAIAGSTCRHWLL